MKRRKRTTVWAYLDGKKLVDVVQAALDNNMMVDDLKAQLIRENPGHKVTRSMCGSQGNYAHIDLTDGIEVIRILVDTFHEWTDISLDGLEIIVGRANSEVIPNCENDYRTLWNSELDIISRERFYEIGADRRHGKFYGTLEEATAAQQLKCKRYSAKLQSSKPEDITTKAMEIAKRIISREFKVKRINEAKVTITKYNGSYAINYNGKVYRLH